jgi:hypothetical protein
MDQNQQPGSLYTPDNAGQGGQQDPQSQQASSPSEATSPAAANEEVAAIDDAVQNAPVQPADNSFPQNTPDPGTQYPEQAAPDQESPAAQASPAPAEPASQNATPQAPQPEQPTPPPDNETTGEFAPSLDNQTTEQSAPVEDTKSDSQEPLLAWQAAEPAEANARNNWFMLGIVLVAAAVSTAVVIYNGVNFSTIMSIVVVVLAMIAIMVTGRQHSHLESYAIYDDGVAIGDRFYAFTQLRAFRIVSFGNAASVELEPTERFMVRRVMHLDNGTAQQAVELLGQYVPYQEQSDGLANRISSKLNL